MQLTAPVSLLEVTDLTVTFPTADGVVEAVRGLSFSLDAGKTLGVVGESGSGKSVTALTMLGLNPGADTSGSAVFDGKDLLTMKPEELRHVRGSSIAMIFQDPLSGLHPHYRVGWQIAEAIRAHRHVSRADALRQATELLGLVNIRQPEQRVHSYPHELSGGMRQRVMIAMALALKPKLLIADEPTTALDVTVQAQIMELISQIQREMGMAVIVITHDLGVVASVANDVMVMYAGRAAEQADARTGLLPARPAMHEWPDDVRQPRDAAWRPCSSRSSASRRASSAWATAVPSIRAVRSPWTSAPTSRRRWWRWSIPAGTARRAGCHRIWWGSGPTWTRPASGMRWLAAVPERRRCPGWSRHRRCWRVVEVVPDRDPVLVKATNLVKLFPIKRGVFFKRTIGNVSAVAGVGFEVRRGETLGLVGETGCGKSTVARCLTRLYPITSGQVSFEGEDISRLSRRRLRPLRRGSR